MFRPLHTLYTWAATLAVAALFAVSPARSAPIDDCEAYAGTITTDSTQQCLVNGSVTLIAVPGGDAVVPPGYQIGYVLTRTNGLSIEQVGPDPSFTVSAVDAWRIHSLVYDPNTLDFAAILDLSHAYQLQDLLVQGGGGICASLNISGAFTKTTECEQGCEADAGTISALNPDQCLIDGAAQLEALPDGNAVVPSGYSLAHVLTTGPDLLILALGAEPSFSVSFEGPFAIHTLVYDPTTLDLSGIVFGETSAFEIAALLQAGGGPICGSLDAEGAQFGVADCNPVCEAFAGTLTAVDDEVCRVDGIADLDATPNGDVVVPDGYSIAYILARDNGIIENVEPVTLFEWPLLGNYVIHTLVYDPFTINPFEVVLGVTTIEEINSALIQGGGPVCGSLDLTGAPISVIDCVPVCDAYAGTLTAVESEVCRVDGIAHLESVPNGDAVVPAGYSVAYVLARANGIIENVEPNSDFEWPLLGEYVIHTLVYDPATLNPFMVILGVTNISSINGQLLQGGGTICGSLDLVGAAFSVIDCAPPCDEYAGIGGDRILCYTDPIVDLFSLLTGTPDEGGTWTGPDGEAFAGTFNPATDAQGVYVYFVTDGPDCPGDTAQLVMNLIECGDPCNAFAGNDSSVIVCANEGAFNLFVLLGDGAWTGGTWSSPGGQPHASVFIPGIDAPGTYVYSVGDIEPCPGDEAIVSVAVVLPPNAGMDGAATFCTTGPPVNLNGGDGSWYAPNGEPHPPIFSPSTDPAGIYTYTVEGTEPCANDTATLTVSLSIAPNAGASAVITVCDSDAPINCIAELGGDPDPIGTWTSPNGAVFSGTFDPAVDVPGVYTYIVTGTPPCADEQATLVIALEACCNAGEDADTTICFTDPPLVMVNALGGDPCPNGVWTDPAAQAHSGLFNPAMDASGDYSYSVVNDNGSVDVATLTVSVIECPTTCEADAGSISADQSELCLENGSALLVAAPNGDAVVPAGYEMLFVLTTGQDLVLIDADAVPFFTLSDPELYTIHTLVYDPNTLDISAIEFGTTTAAEVAALLIQGGGNVCASLDLAGAQILVIDCENVCEGAAGVDAETEVCNDGSVVYIFPLLGSSAVPGGYWFSTFVLNPPPFNGNFDSMLSEGGTFGYVVSGGPDCAPDTAYVTVLELDCTDPCAGSTPDAGIGGDIIRCTIDPVTELFDLLQGTPDVGGTWTGPDGETFSGTFDPASDASGTYVYTVFDLQDCPPDTTQLNITVIECPELNAQLIAWPNPAVAQLSMRFPRVLSGGASIDIIDALGRSVRPFISISGDMITLDVSTLPAGTYTLRAFDAKASYSGRFARARD